MKKIYYLSIILVFLIYSSCKKVFLDVPTKTRLTLQEHVKDLPTMSEFLNGVYYTLSTYFFEGAGQIYPDLISDNIKPEASAFEYMKSYYLWRQDAQSPDGSNLNDHWSTGYRIIRSCSFVISNTEEYRNENPAKADDLIGQAYALRALTHFILVNEFAQSYSFTPNASHPGIPYITFFDWNEPIKGRNTVAEVYTQLISDLTNSIQLLPAAVTSTLYMNRLAAKSLLARVYLFKEDYSKAKDLAVEVSTEKPIMYTGYPSKLFTLEETEALFQIPPSEEGLSMPGPTGSYQGTYSTFYQGGYLRDPVLFYVPTADIATLLKQNPSDLRNSWIGSGTPDTITKYPGDVVPGFSYAFTSYYPTILRSSEMYLTAAEAYVKLGDDVKARSYINEIRTRANIAILDESITGTALFDSICIERRKELAFEGLRMFDLLRWKKSVVRQDALDVSAQILLYPSDKAIAPIPILDVTVTGLQQNPGY